MAMMVSGGLTLVGLWLLLQLLIKFFLWWCWSGHPLPILDALSSWAAWLLILLRAQSLKSQRNDFDSVVDLLSSQWRQGEALCCFCCGGVLTLVETLFYLEDNCKVVPQSNVRVCSCIFLLDAYEFLFCILNITYQALHTKWEFFLSLSVPSRVLIRS